MGITEINRQSIRPAARDLRGILLALLTALAMWAFMLVGVLGLILKVLR